MRSFPNKMNMERVIDYAQLGHLHDMLWTGLFLQNGAGFPEKNITVLKGKCMSAIIISVPAAES